MIEMVASSPTPLWPAGHLPLKGGDLLSIRPSLISTAARRAAGSTLSISPLEGRAIAYE
ncbi:lytic murein transglycosylase [Mesorhizobium sp. M7A.F.Ca.US.008.03.1.1]|nr:lytic murein transglycosylase [Mesorhizobium sp. M7A.F.Ca.US.008.03.1.1]